MGKRIYEKGKKEFMVGKRERRDYTILILIMRKVITISATTLKDGWDQLEGPRLMEIYYFINIITLCK